MAGEKLEMNYPYSTGWKKFINEYFDGYYEQIAKGRDKQEAFNSFFEFFCKSFEEALVAIDRGDEDAWKNALTLLRHPGIREIMFNLPDELRWVHFPSKGREAFSEGLRHYVDDYQSELLRRIIRAGGRQ